MQRMIYLCLASVAVCLLISACTPNPAIQPTNPIVTQPEPLPVTSPTIPPQPTPEALEVYPPAVWAAIEDLALHLGIDPDQIQVISYQERNPGRIPAWDWLPPMRCVCK